MSFDKCKQQCSHHHKHNQESPPELTVPLVFLSSLPSAFGKCCSTCSYDSLGVWVFFCLFVLEFHWNGITMCSSSRLALLLGIMHWDSSMLPWIALCLLFIHFYCWLGFYSGMYHRVSLLWFMDTWIISSLSYYK